MSIINLTPSQLRKAADLQEKIAELQNELGAILGSNETTAPVVKPAKTKFSAAGIAKIKKAQKLRWAKINADKEKTAGKPVVVKGRKKGGMSAAGKAKIAAAQRLRWAKVKAAKAAKAA